MEIGKVYGFGYQGSKDIKPRWRKLLVEEIADESFVGRLMEEENFEDIRKFRFDRMKSRAVDLTNKL